MSGTLWSKFYWSDWESDPAVRLCSFAAQGFWMRMLCIAAAHDPIGYVAVAGKGLDETALARLTGCQESEAISLLGELDRNGVFSRDRHGRIYSRRMVADAKKAAIARKNGKNGGNPSLSKQKDNFSSDKGAVKAEVKPHKPEAIFQTAATQLGGRGDLVDRLIEAAGIHGNPSPGLAFPGEIIGLMQAGYGLEADILPAIRARPNPKARGWAYFVPQIREAAERRSAVAATPKPAEKSIDWRVWCEAYFGGAAWPHGLGPKPDEPGCKAPADVVEQARRAAA